MSSLIRSAFFVALAASALAAPARRATENHLVRDLRTLTKFAKTVTSDFNHTLATWTGEDVCTFQGVECDKHPDGYQAVAGINLNGAQLGSDISLDGLLNKLTDLAFFHANSNGFVGTIPDVKKLEYLYELDLSNNQLSGPFPTHVLAAPLTFLDIRFNAFTGELPDKLFKSTDMDLIFLNDNQFSGELPEFGDIPTLYISLANNKFTGPIPASLGNVKKLKEILLLGNHFTGKIPEELCALHLDVLDVSGNQLDLTLGPKCQALADRGVLVV